MPIVTRHPASPASGGGGISPSQHRNLDQLVHDVAETSYYEVTYDGTLTWRVSSEIWWVDSGKTVKIRESSYTYTTPPWKLSTIVDKQYDGVGALIETNTGTVTYSGTSISHINWVLT